MFTRSEASGSCFPWMLSLDQESAHVHYETYLVNGLRTEIILDWFGLLRSTDTAQFVLEC